VSRKAMIKSEVAPRAVDAARRAVHTARRALATAKSVTEVKDVRDKADGMRVYAKQAKNKSLELDAAEIRFRAERRLGEFMIAQKKTVGLAKGGAEKGIGRRGKQCGSKMDPHSAKPTLADARIGKHLADRARKWAAMSKEEFESLVAEWRKEFESATEHVTIKLLRPKQLDLPNVASPPLASSGRRLERILETNGKAPPARKLEDICEKIIKRIASGIRQLERLSATIGEPAGVEKFQIEFRDMEKSVMALVQCHWDTHNELKTDAPLYYHDPTIELEDEEPLPVGSELPF